MDLGRKLKNIREAKEISQTQVYVDTGINNKTLSGYERGISEPDLETIKILAKYYNVTIDYLLDNNEEQKSNANYDKDILTIIKARKMMSGRDKQKMMDILKICFDEYFID